MKRNLIAVLFAVFAGAAFAGNGQYSNEAGQQDLHAPIASSDTYRNEAGEQDAHVSIADAGDKGVEEQNSLQLG